MELRSNPQLDDAILPVYQEYRSIPGNEDLSIWSYINMRADLDLAAAFSKLFWPDFVEVDGCVLLAEAYSQESYERWKEHMQGDRQATESIINLTSVWTLFVSSETHVGKALSDSYSLELFYYVGRVLRVCWTHALKEVFPEKEFTFIYEESLTGEPAYITFHQA